ncbi:hypothetical protein ACOYW6_09545 [Parablastomonas sp. CN1-191]|uniref:hypothetical protein n=1 Tax=Parablastomonas sp. CN1-191 TaxID=3400908 RepID=UPI003BF83AAF
MESALLSIREAGQFLGYRGKTFGKSSVFKFLKQHRLSRVRIGGRSFVTRESLEALIADGQNIANVPS